MKKLVWLILIVAAAATNLCAQRAIEADTLAWDYRPEGELRLWTFMVKDSTIGQLASTVGEPVTVDGVSGRAIMERLVLDFNKLGTPMTMKIQSELWIANDGRYLGEHMRLNINDQNEELKLERAGDNIEGYVTQRGKRLDQKFAFEPGGFTDEVNFLDRQELFWAMRDISVGDTVEAPIFMPQATMAATVKATIETFTHFRIYNEIFDSVFVIHYTSPQEQYLYFTADKRLIKADIPSREMKVYLDLVKQRPQPSEQVGRVKPSVISLIPNFVMFLVIGLVTTVFFVGPGYRWVESWLSLLLGGLVFGIVIITQVPLQMYLVEHLYLPKVSAGGSAFAWGLLPVLSAGLIQETLKLGLIYAVALYKEIKASRLTVIGAMCGAGFGILEACYIVAQIGYVELFDLNLIERAFTMLYHTTSGALLGYALSLGGRRWIGIGLAMVVINSVFRFLPIFVQTKTTSPEVMYFALAFISIGLLFAAMLLFRKRTIE